MTPHLVLQLWRQRWDRAQEGEPRIPLYGGKLADWGNKFSGANGWKVPGLIPLLLAIGLLFFFFMGQMRFTLNGQISFAGIVIVIALALRWITGHFFALMLFWLTVFSGAQYFGWRYQSTLDTGFGGISGLAFTYALIELSLFVYLLSGAFNRLWPIAQEERSLSLNDDALPTLDIICLGAKFTPEQAIASLEHLLLTKWPERKTRITFVDFDERASLVQFCKSKKIRYLSFPIHAGDLFASLSFALAQSVGEMVMVVREPIESWRIPATDLFSRIFTWFRENPSLSLVYSAGNFLAPEGEYSPHVKKWLSTGDIDIAVFKRDVVMTEQEALDELLPVLQAALIKRLSALWRKSALVVFDAKDKLLRVDRAHHSMFIAVKHRIAQWHSFLKFYHPAMIGSLFLVPTIVGLLHRPVIDANFEWFAAYAIPAWLLMALLHGRTCWERRFSIAEECREHLLALYFPFATAKSFLTAITKHPKQFLLSIKSLNRHWVLWARAFALWVLILTSACASVLFFLEFTSVDTTRAGWNPFYFLWAIFLTTLLLSRRAALQEARQITLFHSLAKPIDFMVRLPHGKTSTGTAQVISEFEISVQTPKALHLALNENATIQLSYSGHTWEMTAQPLHVASNHTVFKIMSEEKGKVDALRSALRTRSLDWPEWLPGPNADQPLPPWLTNFIKKVPSWVIDSMTKLAGLVRWEVVSGIWKKRA